MKTARLVPLLLLAAACNQSPAPSSAPATSTTTPAAQPTTAPTTAAATAPASKAVVGSPAPDFTLTDLDGKSVTLSSFKGKTVVLEWFNPGCPFVRKSHTLGSLKELPARAVAQGVVWLAVNSSGKGKEGNGVEANRKVAAEFGMKYPVLIDENGAIGHTYGATNTPNMFVVDDKGTLVYRGAIDNSPDAEGQSPTDGKLVNYVDAALEALKAHQPVKVPETKAYGCGVKYAS
jgi:peroxiredoxin